MSRHRPMLLALGLACLCALPGLGLPVLLDTWYQLAALEVQGGRTDLPMWFASWVHPGGWPALFALVPGEPETSELVASTAMPWWTLPELRVVFLRPLSSLTQVVDHALFGLSPVGPRLHSLAWYLALIALVHRLYRPLGRLGALALVLFAVDEGHLLVVVWLAGRNALVSATLGLGGLLLWQRWQQHGWRPGLPLSIALLALALLGGEGALGVVALWLSWQLLAAQGPLPRRLVALWPVVLTGVAWAALYTLGDYGAHGSAHYLDPVSDPGRFLAAATTRAPTLLGAQFLGLPVDLAFFAPELGPPLVVGGLVAIVLFAALLRLAWPHLEAHEQDALRWLVPGGLLALLPVLAALPLTRLLLVPGIGLFPAVAAVLLAAWRTRRWLVLGLLGFVHLASQPLGWWGAMSLFDTVHQGYLDGATAVDPSRPALLLPTTDTVLAAYLPTEMRVSGHQPWPDTWMVTTLTKGEHQLVRTGPSALRLVLPQDQPFGDAPFENVFRDLHTWPLEKGEVHRHGVADFMVAEVDARGRPTVIDLALDVPVEQIALMRWTGTALEELPTPAIGETVALPTR